MHTQQSIFDRLLSHILGEAELPLQSPLFWTDEGISVSHLTRSRLIVVIVWANKLALVHSTIMLLLEVNEVKWGNLFYFWNLVQRLEPGVFHWPSFSLSAAWHHIQNHFRESFTFCCCTRRNGSELNKAFVMFSRGWVAVKCCNFVPSPDILSLIPNLSPLLSKKKKKKKLISSSIQRWIKLHC